MKRSALKRKTWMKRGTTRLRRVDPERAAARRADAFGPCAAMARLLPCAICRRPPPSEPAHVRSRGAGGKDRGNVWPGCSLHHRLQHDLGIATFEDRYGVSLEVIASYVADLVDDHACEALPDRSGRACVVCGVKIDPEALSP